MKQWGNGIRYTQQYTWSTLIDWKFRFHACALGNLSIFHSQPAYWEKVVPTLVIEASCDYNLFFWYHDIGHAAALNNLNIWERSNLQKSFIDRNMANMDFKFKRKSEKFTKTFFWLMESILYSVNLSKQYLFHLHIK